MKYKKIIVLAIFLVSLLAVSAVSAADNATSDVVSVINNNEVVNVENNDDVVMVSENQKDELINLNNDDESNVGVNEIDNDILSTERSVSQKTFNGIQTAINAASSSDVIKLSGTYYGSGQKITISKKISLVGTGETILDARGLSKILEISANGVTISNIKFINGYDRPVGGGIFCSGGAEYVTLKNCIFSNNTSLNGGSHIYWAGKYGTLTNCKFIGGNIEWLGTYASIKNSNFDNTIIKIEGYKTSITNCIFKSFNGYIIDSKDQISMCTFIDTDKNMNNYNLINCKFCDSTKITANAKKFKTTEKTKKYTIKLKDYKGNVIKNVKVTLKVNGKTYSATTNKNGQATFKINKLTKKGTYTATVKFAGNNNYELSSKKVKITVTKPITYKSVKLDVIYSYNKFPKKKLSNGDVIMTTYEKYSGKQWSPGVYATVTHGVGLMEAKNTKLVKCKVWFKNSNGKIITKSSSKFQYNWYIKVGLQKGYTPYKAQIWYK